MLNLFLEAWQYGNDRLGRRKCSIPLTAPVGWSCPDGTLRNDCIVLVSDQRRWIWPLYANVRPRKTPPENTHQTQKLSFSPPCPRSISSTTMAFPTYHLAGSEENSIGTCHASAVERSWWRSICPWSSTNIEPKMFIFDGAFPYRGMLNSHSFSRPCIEKVWVASRNVQERLLTFLLTALSIFHIDCSPWGW